MTGFSSRRSSLASRAALAPILALAVLLAACGTPGQVATVDGEAITFDEVAALIPSDGDTVDTAIFARSLMLVISERVLTDEAERQFGLVFTEADITGMVDELVLQSGLTEEQILADYNLTEASLRSIGAQQLLADRIIAELVSDQPDPSDEEMMARYEAMLPSITQVCSSHILLETAEEAQAALERAAAGEDFAALAMELSTGPSGPRGGDLGCTAPAGYVPEFAAAVLEADPGVPAGPVETQFGWHVILVSDRQVPGFEDMRAEIAAELKTGGSQDLWVAWLTDSLVAADVEVEAEYGTWTTTPAPNVLPPGS